MIALYVVLVGILIAVVATFIALLVLINRIARAERPKRNADAKRRQSGPVLLPKLPAALEKAKA